MEKAQAIPNQRAEELLTLLDSKLLKALSEPVRGRILRYLIANGRSNIDTIARQFKQDRSVISRHLHQMAEMDILVCEKDSRNVFYDVNADSLVTKLESIVHKVKDCMHACCRKFICKS